MRHSASDREDEVRNWNRKWARLRDTRIESTVNNDVTPLPDSLITLLGCCWQDIPSYEVDKVLMRQIGADLEVGSEMS